MLLDDVGWFAGYDVIIFLTNQITPQLANIRRSTVLLESQEQLSVWCGDVPRAMKVTGVVAFVLLCGALAQGSDVLEFNDDNFEDSVAEHDMILVEFFAPW